jgi:hypothetical protein
MSDERAELILATRWAAIANALEKIEAAQRLLAEGVRELAAALVPDEVPSAPAPARRN